MRGIIRVYGHSMIHPATPVLFSNSSTAPFSFCLHWFPQSQTQEETTEISNRKHRRVCDDDRAAHPQPTVTGHLARHGKELSLGRFISTVNLISRRRSMGNFQVILVSSRHS